MMRKEERMTMFFASRRKDREKKMVAARELDLIHDQGDGTYLVTLPSRDNEVVAVDDYTTARILEQTERIFAIAEAKNECGP